LKVPFPNFHFIFWCWVSVLLCSVTHNVFTCRKMFYSKFVIPGCLP
jgi:hypothetical protein